MAYAEANRDKVEGATMKRLQELKRLSQSNGFNVRLIGDLWLLALLFAAITLLIGRERPSEVIGWFPDRDDMTNWCEGIWQDFAFWDTRAFADVFNVDLRATQITVGLPDRSTGREIMWFRAARPRASMPMLRRPHDRHRDIRTRTRFARLFARRTQDRHIMIEIASPAAPQLGSLFRWSFDRATPARPKILRPTFPSTAAEKNIIP